MDSITIILPTALNPIIATFLVFTGIAAFKDNENEERDKPSLQTLVGVVNWMEPRPLVGRASAVYFSQPQEQEQQSL